MKIKIFFFLCVLLFPLQLQAEEQPVLEERGPSVDVQLSKGLPKLAVLPFRTTKGKYQFLGGDQSFIEVARLFRAHCLTAMTGTRRFSVVSGDDLGEMLQAHDIERAADAPGVTQMEMGKALGLDYILTGTILEAHGEYTPYFIQVSGERGKRYHGSFVVDYQLMVIATGEVKWARSVVLKLDDAGLQKLQPALKPEQAQSYLLRKTAELMAQNLMADMFPLRVATVQGNGQVIVNHGEGLVRRGDFYEVFSQGNIVFDPETGADLGVAETLLAVIKINRIAKKVAYATIIDGDLTPDHVGSICRYKEKKNPRRSHGGRISDVQPTYEGGVVLPFD